MSEDHVVHRAEDGTLTLESSAETFSVTPEAIRALFDLYNTHRRTLLRVHEVMGGEMRYEHAVIDEESEESLSELVEKTLNPPLDDHE